MLKKFIVGVFLAFSLAIPASALSNGLDKLRSEMLEQAVEEFKDHLLVCLLPIGAMDTTEVRLAMKYEYPSLDIFTERMNAKRNSVFQEIGSELTSDIEELSGEPLAKNGRLVLWYDGLITKVVAELERNIEKQEWKKLRRLVLDCDKYLGLD